MATMTTKMTRAYIDSLFPPSYNGTAQISDMRLILTEVLKYRPTGVLFDIVNSVPERDALEAVEGQICKVSHDNTYIFHEEVWVVLVDGTGGGGPPTGRKYTDNFKLTSLDQQNGYVDLTFLPDYSDHFFIFHNGQYLILGIGFDCTISNNRLYFNPGVIHETDHVVVKYSY